MFAAAAAVDEYEALIKDTQEWNKYLSAYFLSFTTADAIYSNRKKIEAYLNTVVDRKGKLSSEIDHMKALQKSGARNYKQVASKCREHQNIHILEQSLRNAHEMVYQRELMQNGKTRILREYITNHFGKKVENGAVT